MGMARHEMDGVGSEQVEHLRAAVGRHGIAPREFAVGDAVAVRELDVHPHEDCFPCRNPLQVGFEPPELVGRQSLRIVEFPDGSLCAARVGEEGVVELDVVDVADVEGVVGRAQIFAPRIFGFEIVGHVGIVVVVARNVVDRNVEIGHLAHVVRRLVAVLVPVFVPRQIAERHGVEAHALGFRLCDLFAEVGFEAVFELVDVVGTVGQMRVREDDHAVPFVGFGRQYETALFVGLGRTAQPPEELGNGAVDRCAVSGGDGDEDVASLFERREVVTPLVVGGGHEDAVRNRNARDRFARMVDHAAVDGAAGYLRHLGAVDHVDEGRAQVEGFPVFIEGEVVHAPDETGGRLQGGPLRLVDLRHRHPVDFGGIAACGQQQVIVGAGAAARKQESVGEAHLHDIRNLVGGDIGELVRFVGI